MKTLYDKKSGQARSYEAVDAREILASSPDLYTDIPPKGSARDPDGDGREGAPQNVASVENEFRREPVGDDPPAKERDQTIIRNPVTDRPRMADPAAGGPTQAPDFDEMTVADLKDYAAQHDIDLHGATLKDDILKKVKKG